MKGSLWITWWMIFWDDLVTFIFLSFFVAASLLWHWKGRFSSFLRESSQMPGVQKEALERLMEVKPLRVAAAWWGESLGVFEAAKYCPSFYPSHNHGSGKWVYLQQDRYLSNAAIFHFHDSGGKSGECWDITRHDPNPVEMVWGEKIEILIPLLFTNWKVKRTEQLLVHPGRLTWNLQITHLERKMIFQTSMIVFHVNLPGCIQMEFSVFFLWRPWVYSACKASLVKNPWTSPWLVKTLRMWKP